MATDDVEMNPKPTPTGGDVPPGSGHPIDAPPAPPEAGIIDSPAGPPDPETTL